MICNIPNTDVWTSHLTSRADEAKELGLLANSDALSLSSAKVFFPDNLNDHLLATTLPNCPLSEIKGIEKSPGWIRRDDLFDETALWIFDKYSSVSKATLYCESAYSKQGDKVLENREHIVFRDAIFLTQNIPNAKPDDIAKNLRWGRSWRILGIIAEVLGNQPFSDNDINRLLFICDAFDGDSIIVTELR